MESATQRLKDRCNAMRAAGMVDVKFSFSPNIEEVRFRRLMDAEYVPPASFKMPTLEEMCQEVLDVFEAVDAGLVQEFSCGDSQRERPHL